MNGHGLVIGGGIGGLLAGHALTGRFERVTVLERDCYPEIASSPAPVARRGVPQSRCLHLLMAAGAVAFDSLVPGWRDELVALGAVPFDISADAAIRFPAGWLPRTPSGITAYACSRALLEDLLCRRLARHAGVHVREGVRVLGLSGGAERVTGVRVAGPDDSGDLTVKADLVVDATGRGSLLPDWLAQLHSGSTQLVEETIVDSGTQYVSRWFHLDPEDAPEWQCLSIAPAVEQPFRSAMMLRAERDRWGVVLLAATGEPLPADDTAFLDFAGNLADGKLREVLARARPLSAIQHYGLAANRIRHYDRWAAWPSGLAALGDSVCALDPYFGLGMTVAGRGAALLRAYVEENSVAGSGLEFQKRLATLHSKAWQLATGCDVDGEPLPRNEPDFSRLYEIAPKNAEIAHALLAVQHLLRPVETLMDLCPK
jgi:2-polyprenyl-6-methoxyphenol hydroxylase-like FAD-dependent oxidoreductase